MSTKTSNKPKKEKPISSYFELKEGKLVRLSPACDRCGLGYYMADHGDRYSCGHCGFTRYKVNNTEEE